MATFKSILLWVIFGTWANTPRGQLATEDHGELGPTWSWSGYSGSYAVSRDSEVVLRCLSWCKDFSPKRCVSLPQGTRERYGMYCVAFKLFWFVRHMTRHVAYFFLYNTNMCTCLYGSLYVWECIFWSWYIRPCIVGFPTKEINLAVVVIFTFEVVAKIALFGYRDFFCGRDSWCLGCWLLWSVLVTPFRCPKDKHEVLNERPLHVVSWYAWKAKGATFWLWILQPRWNAFDFIVVALSVAYLKTWADLLDRPKLWHEFEMAVPCATEREMDTKTKMVNSTDMQNATMNIQRICECMNT